MKIKVLDQKGKSAGEITVDASVFGAEVNKALVHEVAVAQANNQRQGTKSTLTRSEVRGHAAKPYRQKGTGRARQGSTKGPHQDGGGVAFAPKPRDFSTKINKKKRHAALVSALSGKLADGEMIVLKDFKLKEPKTKLVADIVESLKLGEKSVMFITAGQDEVFLRGANNIPSVSVNTDKQISVLDIVTNKFLVLCVDAVKAIEEVHKS
ncbi:MAG: 50S ribosomal protein L4 [Firmicutes bacterium]|nr:50S ribosomal protein L4 [Bacillota bacterium]